MWHKRGDEWCHAWDVEESAYRAWKEGTMPLPASAVFLPEGRHPVPPEQVRCGTCKSTRIRPTEMRQEFMRQ